MRSLFLVGAVVLTSALLMAQAPAAPGQQVFVSRCAGCHGTTGNGGELEIQMGVHHGFAFPQRWCYDKPAAERHWERLIALYRRRLG